MDSDNSSAAATEKATIASQEVVTTATDAASATERARTTDTEALLAHLEDKLEEHNQKNMATISEAMVEVVNDALGKLPTRYFDSSRIPLICKSIFNIEEKMSEQSQMLKDTQSKFVAKDGEYWIIRMVVFTFAGLVLSSFVTALIMLVFRTAVK